MPTKSLFRVACGGALLLVVLAYANHWTNPFHFDDGHTIVENPSIRSLANLPRLLTDPTAASVFPTHAVYRPLTYVTLAVDYALAGGLTPWVFHASTFVAFLAIIALIFLTAGRMLDTAAGAAAPEHKWWALFAATLYGVHPVSAETVNYVIQRAELWAALGVLGSVALFALRPGWRRYGLYLVPGVLGTLAKPVGGVFPFAILLYHVYIERGTARERWTSFGAAIAASALVTGLSAVVTLSTGTFDAGAPPAAQYRWTQPWVTARYLRDFVLPVDLSIDVGWRPLDSPFEPRALVGYACVLAILAAAVWLARRRRGAVVGFGLAWFLVTLLPVAMFPLAEVTNDHRMFLPFIGLAFAAAGIGCRLTSPARRGSPSSRHDDAPLPAGTPTRPPARSLALVAGAVLVLLTAAAATWQRNATWSSDERLWLDAVTKNPENGRALMNHGVALLQRGDYAGALAQFQRAAVYTPNYDFLEVNLGVAEAALGRDARAEAHFKRAIAVAPQTNVGYRYYGRWLLDRGRVAEAVWYLEHAVATHPDSLEARHDLIRALTLHRAFARLQQVAVETLDRAPEDAAALAARDRAAHEMTGLAAVRDAVRRAPTPEGWLDLSLRLYNAGDFAGSIDAARQALLLRPAYAEAFNNIAAAHNALGQWPEGVAAAEQALAINPGLTLAQNNLAWARAHVGSDP